MLHIKSDIECGTVREILLNYQYIIKIFSFYFAIKIIYIFSLLLY